MRNKPISRDEYNLSPKYCLECGNILLYEQRRNKYYCSHKCSADITHLNNYIKIHGRYTDDLEHQRNAGKMSRYYENKKVIELEKIYGISYLPQTICDRIFIINDKIVFIEIKQKGKKLRLKQKEFKELCEKLGYEYRIEYIENV